MKKFIWISGIMIVIFGGMFILNYIEKLGESEDLSASSKNGAASESDYYARAEKALVLWEKAGSKNEIEKAFAGIQEKNIGRLSAENPFVMNMLEGFESAKLALPKELEENKEKKLLKNADSFVYAGKQYYTVYYKDNRGKELRCYEDTNKGLVEIKLEGITPAALYGFKTIKFSKNDIPVLVAMIFAGDDSWSKRIFYIMDEEGKFKRIYSFEGAWVEERYADIDGDKILEIILQRRLDRDPGEAAEIIKELKDKNFKGYNAIFYEHEIIKWDPKDKKMAKAGAIVKTDFSHKE